MMRSRRAVSLAVTIGVVSLIAILSVATLALAGRAVQGSSIGIRDARLDGAVALGLMAAMNEWRERSIGRLAIGATVAFPVSIPGVPVAVSVTASRVGPEVFWIVAEALAEGGAARRENLVVRLRIPDAQALLDGDSTDVTWLGVLQVDSLAAHADGELPGGSTISGPLHGVIHVKGDATLAGAAGEGILIVEGHLAIVGSFTYSGVIVARGGLLVAANEVSVFGMIRAAGDPPISGPVQLTESQAAVQDVLVQALTPAPVSGRRWAEMY